MERGTVVCDYLNLRTIPGSDDDDVICAMTRGTKFTVLRHQQGRELPWLRVKLDNGQLGWCAQRKGDEVYVAIEQLADPIEPEPAPLPPPKVIVQDSRHDVPMFVWPMLGVAIFIAFLAIVTLLRS